MAEMSVNRTDPYRPTEAPGAARQPQTGGGGGANPATGAPQLKYVPITPPPVTSYGKAAGVGEPVFKLDRTGAFSSDAHVFHTQKMLAAGRPARWLVVNLSGLKYINDTVSHDAGDYYLVGFSKHLRRVAESHGLPAKEIVIVRDGPHFALLVPDAATAEAISRDVKVTDRLDFVYKKRTVRLTAANLGKQTLVTPGILVYDAAELAGGISDKAVYRGLREEIYYLNRPEASAGRFGREFRVGRQESGYLETFTPAFRLPNYDRIKEESRAVQAPAGSRYVEPHSGLRDNTQLGADATALLRGGRRVRFAFFDGNSVGAFRSLGFIGEAMMDAVVEVRFAQAASRAGLAEKGITLYRHGPGSEEFYLLADENVPPETMKTALADLMKELNESPFDLRVETSRLKETVLGRQYLQRFRPAVYELGGVEYVTVDLTQITRGRAGVYYRGLTVTAGFGTIELPGSSANLDVYFNREKAVLMEYGEAGKKLNPQRRNLIVEVRYDNQGKAYGLVHPLGRALADPRPIAGQNRSGLIDQSNRDGLFVRFIVDGDKLVYEVAKTDAPPVITMSAKAAFEQARAAALARIDKLPVSAAEKAEARRVAAAAWEKEWAEFEHKAAAKQAFEKDLQADYYRARALQREIKSGGLDKFVLKQKKAELAELKNRIGMKVNGFLRQHGPMMAVIIALDIAIHWDEIRKEGAGKAVKVAAGAVEGYFVFFTGLKVLENTAGAATKISPVKLGGALAAGLAALSSTVEHREHLSSSDAATKAYAALAVAVQALTAYIAASAGLAAAKVARPFGFGGQAVAGVGVGFLTFIFMETAGKTLGTDRWIGRKWTRGDIINAFHDLGARRDGSGVLAVRDQDTEIPYFSEVAKRIEVNGRTVSLTRAQAFLGILQAARNYDQLSFEERRALADQPGNRALTRLLGALGSLDRLEVGNYAELDEELLEAVADAIGRYRAKHHLPEDTSGSRTRFEVVCSNRRRVNIVNPLTGEVVGSRTFADIKVFGERQHFAMLATGNGWVSDEGTVGSYAISGPIKTEGDEQQIRAAEAILATASKAHPGTYDISLAELAALDLTIPADKLAALPVVRRDLAKQLSLLGYKADGDIVKAYLKYVLQSLDLTQPGPQGVTLNLSARQAAADPFQVNLETSVLRRLTGELLAQ
ncbi:MAG: hypothetical protein JW873_04980 [Candidatus Saganbacteria bacterium]|nr:hypothetical protein [Candidatus Saganbacteria bacterium]